MVVLCVIVMVSYTVLGVMAAFHGYMAGSAAGNAGPVAPAFTYPEFPWIIASIAVSGLIGACLLIRRREEVRRGRPT